MSRLQSGGLESDTTDAPESAASAPSPPTAMVWRVRHAIALVLVVAGCTLVTSRLLRAIPSWGLDSAQRSLAILAAFALAYAIELGIVWLVARRRGFAFGESVGLRPAPRIGKLLGVAAASGLGLRIAATVYAIGMFAMRWQLPGWDSNPTKYFPRGALGSAVMLLIIAGLAPVVEEIIFRGVLLPSLADRFGEKWGIALATAVFAGLHLNLFSLAPILLVGWVLAVLFLRTRSLWVSIACHSAFNGIGILAVLLLRGNGVV